MTQYNEVVFCGFGEPTERFDALKEIAAFVKEKYNKPIRINTNGAGSLINGRDIAPELKGLVDTVSVSLNHPEKEEYLKLVRSKFGEESFDAMLSFAKACTKIRTACCHDNRRYDHQSRTGSTVSKDL